MYGLVSKAIQDLVTRNYGEERWKAIHRKAGIQNAEFIGMQSYPDEETYALVGAASEELGIPAPDLLKAFGDYWISYTAEEGYGEMMKAAGDNFADFLVNLDTLHARVGNLMPNLVPPSFSCEEVTERSMILTYRSTRKGLLPMVMGLLSGLGRRFGVEPRITVLSVDEKEDTEARFRLEW